MNEATREVMFSSASENWATPRALLAVVRQEYAIELDVCASAENAACARFYSKEDDAFKQPWAGVCWMNPPYGRGIGRWIERAARAAAEGATVVCLLPARTDTKWWHAYCEPVLRGRWPGEVVFLAGRLHFNEAPSGAPFPSVLVVFKPRKEG